MNEKSFHTVPFVWNKTLWVLTFALFGLWIGVSAWMLWMIHTSSDPTPYLIELVLFNVII